MYKEILNAYLDGIPMSNFKSKYNTASVYATRKRIAKIDEVLKRYILDKETRRVIELGILESLG